MTDSNYTHLALILDRSGSMSSIARDMNGGIKTLLGEQAAQPGRIVVDVTLFDDKVERPYVGVSPADIEDHLIVPRGGTALLDAVGVTVTKLGEYFATLDESERPGNVVVIVVTDGEENSSREWSAEDVKTLVAKQESEFNWTFSYLAANVDAFATGGQYGFAAGQTMNYVPTAAGAAGVFASASAGITRSRLGGVADYTEDERAAALGESA